MKFQILGLALIIANALNVLADDDYEINFGNLLPSAECTAEIAKYEECLADKIQTQDETEYDDMTKEQIEKLCNDFEADKCKTFREDATSTTSACFPSTADEKPNLINMMNGMIVISLKGMYLLYCTKGTDGKTCPLTDYMINNAEAISKVTNDDDLPEAAKKAIADDCKDSKCNERMVAFSELSKLDELIDQLDSKEGNGDTAVVEEEYDFYTKYIENYKQKTCNVIDGSKADDKDSSAFNIQKITYSSLAMMIVAFLILM
eukprot:jgi/Orpsp1_1/1177986/evm.model.c7180000063634.1